MSTSGQLFPWLAAAEPETASTPSWIAPRRTTLDPRGETSSGPIARVSALPRSVRVPSAAELPRISVAPEPPPPPPYPDLRDENAALKARIAEIAVAQARFRSEVLRASEGELVRLACAIAERVAGRELHTDPEIVLEWAREAIEALGAKEDVIIALAPDLAQMLCATDWSSLASGPVGVETDPSLGPLQMEVRVRSAAVEAGVASRLAAVTGALGEPAE